MPAFARHQIVAKGEIGAYHCIARCVRRAFLCGKDAATGKNFEHRKAWARDRLRRLAEAFAIDVGAYAVMGIDQKTPKPSPHRHPASSRNPNRPKLLCPSHSTAIRSLKKCTNKPLTTT